jgi:hypothetical protein
MRSLVHPKRVDSTALLLLHVARTNSSVKGGTRRTYTSFAGALLALISWSPPTKRYNPSFFLFSSAFVVPSSSPLTGVTARLSGVPSHIHHLSTNSGSHQFVSLNYRGGGSFSPSIRRLSIIRGSSTTTKPDEVVVTSEENLIMSSMTPSAKLDALRQRMKELDLDVYLVPTDDPHLCGMFFFSNFWGLDTLEITCSCALKIRLLTFPLFNCII